MELLELNPGTEPALLEKLLTGISRIDSAVFGDSRWGVEAFAENVSNDYDYLTAVREGSKVLGYGLLRCFDDAEIIMIAVDPSFRRQGIGRMLLRDMIEEAGQRKVKGIFLEVRESNLAAGRMYEEAGFTKEGLRRNYYHEPTENAVIMRYLC